MLENERKIINQAERLGIQAGSILNPQTRWGVWDRVWEKELGQQKQKLAEQIEFCLMEKSTREFASDRVPGPEEEKAIYTFFWLKRNLASYGDYVINFALPQSIEKDPFRTVDLPENLFELVWKMAPSEKSRSEIPMARVDAIRTPQNGIKIIEVNYSWVDNLWILQASQEVFGILTPQKPTDVLIAVLLRAWGDNLGLVYQYQTDGCLKDDMAGLKKALEKSGKFNQVVVARLKDLGIDPATNEVLLPVNRTKRSPVKAIYLNGDKNQCEFTETGPFNRLTRASQEGKVILCPSQNPISDDKNSLVRAFNQNPEDNLIAPTFAVDPQDLSGPRYFGSGNWENFLSDPRAKTNCVLKPAVSQSLKGVLLGCLSEEAQWQQSLKQALTRPQRYVLQEYCSYNMKETTVMDTKTKKVEVLEQPFEKLNIWILGNSVLGVMATYGKTPKINDAGFNMPIQWRLI